VSGRPGFAGYQFGSADEDEEAAAATEKPLEDLPATDAKGKATFPVALDKTPDTSRPMEATIVVRGAVVSWRHPARRALQLDEWLSHDLRAGIVEPPCVGHDLAILLTKIRRHDVALLGSRAAARFESVPRAFVAALPATVAQWHAERDWRGDEYAGVLAHTRIQ